MIDFAALPPEINSARMYAGAGAEPLLSASAAWDATAARLAEAAASITSTVMGLAAAWIGPSATAMSAAATTYTAWLTSTAEQAAQTAAQATVAVAAYETAFAATVPPPVIATNRLQLAVLVSTNFLGINAPAIMATEALYAEMWAQDAAAMTAYQAESAAATSALPQFTPAPQTTTGANPAAVTQAAATSTMPAQSILSWLTNPNDFLTALSNPATPVGFVEAQWLALQSSGVYQVLSYPLIMGLMGQANGMMSRANDLTDEGNRISTEMEADDRAQAKLTPPVAEMPPPAKIEKSPGGVSKAGALTVPPNWDKQTQQVKLASAATPLTTPLTTPGMGGMIPTPIAAVNAPGSKQRKGEEILVRVKFVPTEGV